MARISKEKIEKYLFDSANFLRGNIDAGDYKQFIFPLLFFKRVCDVYDEEYAKNEAEFGVDFDDLHMFNVPKEHHWNVVREKNEDLGQALQTAMREIEKANLGKLEGIFGDAQWTNKERLPDRLLKDLLEHFSMYTLSIENVPDDELGTAYEYLIKEFADDSGHTAQEFYSNRTLVKLMAEMLDAKPGDSVYDPTCGTGGMLLITATHLKEKGEEYRSLKLYGQEVNLITSSIARMNMFLHGIEDFSVYRGDVLADPGFMENDELRTFDIVLANPPYSIKRWDRDKFMNDPYGRNIYGVPPQGCADYAFIQHIIKSMNKEHGKCAILLPHGVLFRDSEQDIRRKMIEDDIVECVLGLGPNLFYNSSMEACVLICNMNKSKKRKNKILFINAVNEVRREKTMSYMDKYHRDKIENAYKSNEDIEGFSRLVDLEEISRRNFNLNIPLYVLDMNEEKANESIEELVNKWCKSSDSLKTSFNRLMELTKEVN
ncbi:type I restriction-modification system subunit M [Paraclostridium sordellii]|uniref:type I restriction-modification system subunit M n=1 Tax=Paraclostridium sordellii TaxID=1505 RepID=UPI0005E00361|nr:class I SAM-dependent DNA methyltransferase [Paeniclostridium sordellii]CEQ21385.1 type I restriction system adenine methylase HsdM [[Clostridium] sordellii] [Paeniclostridium sordellii]